MNLGMESERVFTVKMKKTESLRTYGRHRNRRIVATDVWLSDQEKKHGVFSTSSENECSTSIFHSSSSSCQDSLNATGDNSFKPAAKNKKTTSENSSLASENGISRPALRDRNKHVDYNDSLNLKKQLRGTTAKRKRPVRICVQTKCNNSSMNFSDFDDYYLCIDSPSDVVKKSNRQSMDTSTPVVKRTRAAKNVQKVTNLSHIENLESPISDTGYNSVQTPESTHSQSVYETPSVVSSQGSRVNDDNLSEVNADDTGRKAVVQLKKLADSFVAYATSDSAKSHAFKSRRKDVLEDQSYDNSKSLFSGVGAALSCSPCDSKNHRLTRATAQRRGVKPERICLDDSNEESVNETDEISHDEHEDDNIEVSVGSESTEDDEEDYHTSEGETEDLSAIAEGEEISEEDESDTECVESDGSEEYETESDSEQSRRLSGHTEEEEVEEERSSEEEGSVDEAKLEDDVEEEERKSVLTKHRTRRLSGHTEEEEVESSSGEEGNDVDDEMEDDVIEEEEDIEEDKDIEDDVQVSEDWRRCVWGGVPQHGSRQQKCGYKELSNLRTSKGSMTASFCEVNDVSCFETISQGKSVLTQVAYALAVAEEKLQFEHRDLHWGNVLVRPTEDEVITFQLLGKTYEVPSMGVEASVIDFTLSRLTKDGCTVFTDLSVDPALFEGKGDYQFDIYRLMKEGNGNQWKKFEARSNVLWLHYLADKLIYATRYPSQSGRQDRDVIRQFRQFTASMLNYNSSVEMVVDALFLNSLVANDRLLLTGCCRLIATNRLLPTDCCQLENSIEQAESV
ncbi:HASP-like protein, partial [Mya arenaria]